MKKYHRYAVLFVDFPELFHINIRQNNCELEK